MRPGPFTVALVLATSPPVIAAAAPTPTPALEATWYGWQTLIADALDAGVWLLLIKTVQDGGGGGSVALGVLGVAGYLVPAPVIHGMHEQGGMAALSAGIRLAAPTLLGFFGAATATCQSSGLECLGAPIQGAFVGAVAGVGLAVVLDAAALSWKQPDDPAAAQATSSTTKFRWLPTASLAYDEAHKATPTFGIGGSF
jgi:hypothetical protein